MIPNHDYGHSVVGAIERILAWIQPHRNNQVTGPILYRYRSPHGLVDGAPNWQPQKESSRSNRDPVICSEIIMRDAAMRNVLL